MIMKFRLVSIVLLAAAFNANAQKFITYKEAADPVPVSEASVFLLSSFCGAVPALTASGVQ